MFFGMVLICLAFSFLNENFLAGDAVPFTGFYQNISFARKRTIKSLKGYELRLILIGSVGKPC